MADTLKLLTQAYVSVEDEMLRRGLLVSVPAAYPPAFNHIVGRTVLLVGSDAEGYEAMLTEQGYRVTLANTTDTEFPDADTVVVLNYDLPDETFRSLFLHAGLAMVCVGSERPIIGLSRIADNTYAIDKYHEENAPVSISTVASVRSRTKTAAGSWDYILELSDNVTVRALSDTEFPNGTRVNVSAEGVITTGDKLGLLHSRVIAETDLPSDSPCNLLSRAQRADLLFQGSALLESEDFINRAGFNKEYTRKIRHVLRGFAGTFDEAVTLVKERVPEAITEPDRPFGTVSLQVLDDAQHMAWGIVLEPNVPYGKRGIWFSRDTVAAIVDEGVTVGAVDHVDSDEVRVTESFIDTDGKFARPGSWIVGCEVSDAVFEKIQRGEYTGLSIKGTAVLAG